MCSDGLYAISPVDGRYASRTAPLSAYFSEAALIRYRILVEAEYLNALRSHGPEYFNHIPQALCEALLNWARNLPGEAVMRVKEIEKTTNHDVKAVEYVIKEYLDQLAIQTSEWAPSILRYKEFVHFGLTSQDINNTAYPMMMRDAIRNSLRPALQTLVIDLNTLASDWDQLTMLAHTHGQPASPTRLGKELKVFVARLERQLSVLDALPFPAKFGGATGNFNAHTVAFPDVDWHSFGNRFVAHNLGLTRSFPTTQIEHYDGLSEIFDALRRVNVILTDMAQDFWLYISFEYLVQRKVANEVGSSAMPHKVNPIDFENAEGNFHIANALFEVFSRKLPVSRLQRDLTDSTIMRNIGVAFAHSLLGYASLQKGLGRVEANPARLEADLESNWAVVAEGIQTILRREGYPNPYEALKELTRGRNHIGMEEIHEFIHHLGVSEQVKRELLDITPHNYTGQSGSIRKYF